MAAALFCLVSSASRANASEDFVALWLLFEFTSPSPSPFPKVGVHVENVWKCSFALEVTSDKDDEESDDEGDLFAYKVNHLEIEDDAVEVEPIIILAREAKTRLCHCLPTEKIE